MILVFVVALIPRVGWGLYRFSQGSSAALEFGDEQQYWMMAESLQSGTGLVDELGFRATRMPFYPGVMSLFVGFEHGVAWAKGVQWLLGAIGATLVVGAGATWFGLRVGLIAGLLVAVDPFLVFFSSLLLTETGFVVLLAGFWWIMGSILESRGPTIGRWIWTGAVASLCVYQRESSLGLVLATIGIVVIFKRFSRRDMIGAATAVVCIVLALLPWAMRNKRIVGEWCWLTTRGGISLYDGVGPQATGASDLGDVKQMPAVAGLSEIEWNRFFLNESSKAIQENPGRIAMLAATKMSRMWNPFPNVGSYQSSLFQWVSVIWFLPTMLLALVGAVLVCRSPATGGIKTTLFLLLPAVYLSLVHCFFVGSVRYRLGALPCLHILSAFALVALVDRLRNGVSFGGQSVGK